MRVNFKWEEVVLGGGLSEYDGVGQEEAQGFNAFIHKGEGELWCVELENGNKQWGEVGGKPTLRAAKLLAAKRVRDILSAGVTT